MAKTVRMTTAQAIVKFLDNQYVSMDGVETKFVEGFFREEMSRVCATLLPLLQNRATAKKSLHALPPLDLELQTW